MRLPRSSAGPRPSPSNSSHSAASSRRPRDAGLPRIFELEAEYEESQLAAELKFVTALVDEMQAGTLEGLDIWRMFQSEDFDPEEVHFTFELPKE